MPKGLAPPPAMPYRMVIFERGFMSVASFDQYGASPSTHALKTVPGGQYLPDLYLMQIVNCL